MSLRVAWSLLSRLVWFRTRNQQFTGDRRCWSFLKHAEGIQIIQSTTFLMKCNTWALVLIFILGHICPWQRGWCNTIHKTRGITLMFTILHMHCSLLINNTEEVCIIPQGECGVYWYKYLGVCNNDRLDWSDDTEAVYRKGQSRLFILRSLKSFEVCRILRCFSISIM